MRKPLDPLSGEKARNDGARTDKAMPSSRPGSREDRLKAALKANMARRKAQAKARHPEAVSDLRQKDEG